MRDYQMPQTYTINEEQSNGSYRNSSSERDDSQSDDEEEIDDFEGALAPSQVEGSSYFIEGSYSNFDLT